MSTELTTMRMAKVTMLAAMPFSRLMNRPMSGRDDRGDHHRDQDRRAARAAGLLASPNGALADGAVALIAAGVDRMAVMYAARPTKPDVTEGEDARVADEDLGADDHDAVEHHDDGDVPHRHAPGAVEDRAAHAEQDAGDHPADERSDAVNGRCSRSYAGRRLWARCRPCRPERSRMTATMTNSSPLVKPLALLGRNARKPVSTKPRMKPPSTAPHRLPSPPMTLAMKPFSTRAKPMCGVTDPRMERISTAAMPARRPDRAKEAAITRLALIAHEPHRVEVLGRRAHGRADHRAPEQKQRAHERQSGDPDDEDVLEADLQPADRQTGVHPVGLGNGARPRRDEGLEGERDEDDSDPARPPSC